MAPKDAFAAALVALTKTKTQRKSKAAELLDPYRTLILQALAADASTATIHQAYIDVHPEAKLSMEAVRRYIVTIRSEKTPKSKAP